MKKKKVLCMLGIMIGCLSVACGWYLNDYYHADRDAITAFSAEFNLTKHVLDDNTIVYQPEHAETGLIFYPGGKVEHTAYEPLMTAMAEHHILTVLVEMPFNLAVFDSNAADGLQAQFPEIKHWYLSGHSLGGAMAASYLSDHIDEYEGLILLASYSTADLSGTELNVLSIYGSEDHVMNSEKYEEVRSNLPEDFTEIILQGGNHAQFGMYGPQAGDGTASISNIDQIVQTASTIIKFMKSEGH